MLVYMRHSFSDRNRNRLINRRQNLPPVNFISGKLTALQLQEGCRDDMLKADKRGLRIANFCLSAKADAKLMMFKAL